MIRKEHYHKIGKDWELQYTSYMPEYRQNGAFDVWKNCLDSRKFFKSIGGREILKGNVLTSICPTGDEKTVYTLCGGIEPIYG